MLPGNGLSWFIVIKCDHIKAGMKIRVFPLFLINLLLKAEVFEMTFFLRKLDFSKQLFYEN